MRPDHGGRVGLGQGEAPGRCPPVPARSPRTSRSLRQLIPRCPPGPVAQSPMILSARATAPASRITASHTIFRAVPVPIGGNACVFLCRGQSRWVMAWLAVLVLPGLASSAAVDETEDTVADCAEAGLEPERPGQRVGGLEVDRDPLVVMDMCPGERSVDERVPDASPARAGQGGGGPNVGLAVRAKARCR